MAERAHPDDSGFKTRWSFRLRRGFIPWWTKKQSPYREAFIWRYQWVSGYCGNKDVLDIPCGMGWGTSLISGAKTLKGLDLSHEAISEAVTRYGDLAEFHVGDMAQLGVPDESIDVVCCLEGIEHVPMDVGKKFLQEAWRVLRPHGRLLISSPYCLTKEHSGNPYHLHEYQPDEIKSLISQSFTILDCETREVDIMSVLYLNCQKH